MATKFDDYVGKDIKVICGNKFDDPRLNHCAHFVAHALGLDFDLSCSGMTGRREPAGNIRVHEIFPKCPKVGEWADADTSRTQLVFVTRPSNVKVERKWMGNIPQKHVGIYHDGTIYHYANTIDKVTVDTPESFLAKFDGAYGQGQSLYFGWVPGDDLQLRVKTAAAEAAAGRKFDLIAKPDPADAGVTVWHAQEAGDPQPFLVGREINQPARKFHGLGLKTREYWGKVYTAADYHHRIDHWAYLLEVTGYCESKNYFSLVNTYDRAKFTFGFYQLAAHTPRDNLILLFRELATLPEFNDYFPELKIEDGHLCRVDKDGTVTDLETELDTGPGGDAQLQFFMNYLNPNRKLIDEQEVLHAARLIHWTQNSREARRAQVLIAAEIVQSKMARRYHPKLGLDGRSDVTCAILCDMLHQGRATYAELRPILQSGEPDAALLTFKDSEYGNRNRSLRTAIERSVAEGKLGTRRYSAAANEFV